MSISTFARAASGSLLRTLWNRDRAAARRRSRRAGFSPAIDTLESRVALAITGDLFIGVPGVPDVTVGTYFDAPTGVANLGDFVTVSIEGTKGTVVFNGGKGVADGTDIQTIEILDASPDFQLTFTAAVTLANPVPYSSDGVVEMGKITTANVIRGINTVRGPLTLTAAPQEIETSAIHLYTFNDGTVSGSTVTDLVGGADGTLFNGASVSNGELFFANISGTGPNVQYMQMPADVIPQGSTAATFELWFTASAGMGTFGRGFDFGSSDLNYLFFTPKSAAGSEVGISQASYTAEKDIIGTFLNDDTQHLVTVTIDDAADTMIYYVDGAQVGTVTLESINLSGLEAVNNFLGRSQFANDPGFIGSMNQFAIYDKVLSPSEVLGNYNAGPISGSLAPIGFTQATPGSATIELEGNQTTVFPVGTLVAATPLLSTTTVGAPTFSTVQAIAFDVNTNRTTVTLGGPTAAGTTAGALTLAEAVRPEFRLTSFVGVNFSNLNLKDGGGLFVDVVQGGETEVNGALFPNLGISLSDGLLAYSTIGIRRELAATVLLGFNSSASVDGRMFVEFATPESLIYVGPQNTPTSKNSKFQLTGGPAPFGAGVYVAQPFDGVVNLGGDATGSWRFERGVGPNAVLNARSWVGQTAIEPFFGQRGIAVNGDFAGTLNSTGDSEGNNGDVALDVSRNLTATARVNAASDISLIVGGSLLKGAVVSSDQGVEFFVAKNVLGTIQAGSDSAMTGVVGGNVSGATIASSNDITLSVLGSILNSSIAADDLFSLSVGKNVTNSTLTSGDTEISFTVGGNVVNSRFLGGLSGDIGGNVSRSLFAAKADTLDDEDPDITLDIAGSMTASHIEATSRVSVDVRGSVAQSKIISTTSDVTLDVGVDIRNSQVIAADDGVDLGVGRDALNMTVVGDDEVQRLEIGRNFSGVVQAGSGDVRFNVGGSVLKAKMPQGSSVTTGGNLLVDVGGNFDASSTSGDLRFFVDGNVSKASRIVAQRVTDWQSTGTANFGIGGRFDGIVNVVEFDAAPDYENVTLIGGGAGAGARFYVDRFFDDNLFFEGNFSGNLRVLQDLVANLNFGGNVDRITIGGTVGSYTLGAVGETNGNTEVKFTPVSISVAGRLLYLNSNSLFQAATPGVNGTFYSLATPTSGYQSLAATGILTTGSYVTVVPTRQVVPPPTPPAPQQYAVPGAPTGTAGLTGNPTTAPFTPYGINVTFSAPTSSGPGGSLPGDGNLPIVYYEYTTNFDAGAGATWRRFSNPAQGPGSNIALPGPSTGGSFTQPTEVTYSVSVRAVNALGPSVGTTGATVVVPATAP